MVKAQTCREVFNDHCNHWGLSEAAHALLHAQARLIDEVALEDVAAGIDLATSQSGSSIAEDGPKLERLLHDEGYQVIPLGGPH